MTVTRGSPGRFLVFEGIDGSGSTTQNAILAGKLREQGVEVLPTQEPSGGPAGMLIRLALTRRLQGAADAFHDPAEQPLDNHSLSSSTLALLYAADRMDHVATCISPNLARGRTVLCDRYLLSTLAYQGTSLDEEWLYSINRLAPVPDLTVFLDLPVDQALSRMRAVRWSRDLFEDSEQLSRIRSRYLDLISRRDPRLGRLVIVDGSNPPETVATEVQRIIAELGLLPGPEGV